MKFFLCLILVFTTSSSDAQLKLPDNANDVNAASEVISKPDVEQSIFGCIFEPMPEFPGGEAALYKYIQQNTVYPDSANKHGVQGTVRVQFMIEEDGSISDVLVKRPLGFGMDEEAIGIIKSMPKWKPATLDGKPVKMKFQIPIKFSLDDNPPSVERPVQGRF